ncbi:MAG: hypothetical protein H7Z40_04000 [Phycisphaerae bacterium]|nr:hypothetical protein [Gemmatimonadaceae bacterium]
MILLPQSDASPLVASIVRAVEPWQTIYSEHTAVSTLVLFVHLSALVASAGLAVANDRAIVSTHISDGDERVRKLTDLSLSHRSVLMALTVSFSSGLALLLADFEAFMGMPAFWVKMLLIVLLIGNASVMRRREGQLQANANGVVGSNSPQSNKLWHGLRKHAWTSLTLWFAIVLAGTAMTSG